jgi:hypothetical protein
MLIAVPIPDYFSRRLRKVKRRRLETIFSIAGLLDWLDFSAAGLDGHRREGFEAGSSSSVSG